MIKAAFFDIDGTLLPFGTTKFPESTRKTLDSLHKNGVKLFLCSGRPPIQFPLMGEEINNYPFDGMVLLNGQYCVDEKKESFYKLPIPKDALVNLATWLQKQPFPIMVMELDHSYSNVFNQNFHDYVMSIGKPELDIPIEPMTRMLEHDTYQICPYIGEEVDETFLSFAPGMKSARWSPDFADMIPEAGGKDVGMQKMLEHYGLTKEEAIAFGDGANDIPMLKYASIGVAMGNARENVKAIADYITTDADQDGIYNACMHYDLI